MKQKQKETSSVDIQVENIGGIEATTASFEPGVTILTGRNATNRTSFLQAIMAALGSDEVSLKGDAENGSVTLEVGDQTYTRELERHGDEVVLNGEPYLSEPELAELFAFLLETNETRRNVALGGDLRDVIMRPVDAESIESEIRTRQSKLEEIVDKIEHRESQKSDLQNLEEERVALGDKIESKREALEAKRAELEELSTDASQAQQEQSELESKMADLRSLQSDVSDIEFRIESQHESIESLQGEREELEGRLDDLETDETDNIDEISAEISQLREQKQQLDAALTKLQKVIQFNEEMLEGSNQQISAALQSETVESETDVTEKLLNDAATVVCWTCGTEVESDRVDEIVELLRDLRKSRHEEKREIEDKLTTLKEQKSSIESRRKNRSNLQRRLEKITTEIEERTETVADLEVQQEELEERIDSLETEIETLEEADRSEVLSVHRECNQLEVEVDRLENKRDNIAQQIEEIEAVIDEIDPLTQRKADIKTEIQDLRTRIDRLEAEAVETFNDQMDTILDILEFDNLDRIWVDRIETETRQGRKKVNKSEFRLHIVRKTADGVAYEDKFEHLSESEREVTSLVFALAGYLAHDVHEEVPFMLLDSLEAIDAERIAKLVEYLDEFADYLVVALLREDAAALSDEFERITDI